MAESVVGGYLKCSTTNGRLRKVRSCRQEQETLDAYAPHRLITTIYETSRKKFTGEMVEIIQLFDDQNNASGVWNWYSPVWANWSVAPQIKFDIIIWDGTRFSGRWS